ncbi:MAG: HRDC domain-containing protein [Xanthomonadales bacterium]|nr:HRDC domain-containing protein [Xanthomonadales bacterium]
MARWVADRSALNDTLAQLRELPRLALDTEFERIRTYWPKLALVQAMLAGEAALIDPLAFDDLRELGAAIAGPAQTWLMHSPSEDLIALGPLLPQAPAALIDTQVAAALAGLGSGLGYQKLVALVLGVDLAKTETRSDWMRRPLSEQQLAYAADDVVHLDALGDALLDRLEALGRRDWILQEGRRTLQMAFTPSAPGNQHHEYRSACKLDLDAQRRLDAILRWREQVARATDRPKPWVIDNQVAHDLAARPPQQASELQRMLQAQRAFPRAKAGELLELLSEPPLHADFTPAPKPFSRDEEAQLDRLKAGIETHAAELGLEPALLAPRKAQEARLRNGRWPQDLPAWRRERLEAIASTALG